MILFNAGVVHRIGPHRINVRLARRLARHGVASIRFDLSGQGDSARAAGSLPYEQQAVADVRAAMDALAQLAGVRRFVLFGFCSGGNHSYHVAPIDGRVAGVILYDTYFYPTFRTRLNRFLVPVRKKGLLRTAANWAVLRIAQVRRLLVLPGAWSTAYRSRSAAPFPTPSRDELASRLRELHERKTRIAMMYSDDLHRYNYSSQFQDAFGPSGLDRIVDVDFYPGMDHVATELAAQAKFMERIERWTLSLAAEATVP